jgi:hypothetical protein
MSKQAHGSGSVGILPALSGILPDTFAAQCYARLKHTATGLLQAAGKMPPAASKMLALPNNSHA